MRQKARRRSTEQLAQLEELREAAVHLASETPSRSSTPRASTRPASGSRSCSTRAPSRSSTRLSATACTISTCRRTGRGATPSSPATGRSTAAASACSAGLHGLRRLARRGHGREDVQGHGPGGQDRLPGHRHQRLRRRAHPGGRRVARRLRRRLPAQRPLLGRDPADLADHGPVRGRRGLLPRDHGLRLHGQGDLAHVHHRARRDQDRHGRGGRLRGARRGDVAQPKSGVAHFASEDEDAAWRTRATCSRFLPQNNLETAPRVAPTDDPERMDAELDSSSRTPNKPYDMRDVVRSSSTTASSSRSTSTTRRTSSSASRA